MLEICLIYIISRAIKFDNNTKNTGGVISYCVPFNKIIYGMHGLSNICQLNI